MFLAKRQGLPPQVPVPKSKFEGLAEKGLPAKEARGWISDFLNNSEIGKNSAWRKKNRDLVAAYGWLVLSASGGGGSAARERDELGEELSSDERARAEAWAAAWLPTSEARP